MRSPRSLAPYALFFLSGISGLVYQVIWVRQFGNVFGNTVHSAALVTAVFMCGLGAGSYLAGAWANRRYARGPRALLAAYGWSEVLIGAMGVALALALPALGGLSASLSSYTRGAHGWNQLSASSEAVRYTLAALLLAPMTLLMGGTLTLLIRYLVRDELHHAGVRIGALYGLNTAGAALGAFLTDFSLVPSLGLLRAQIASAAINAAAGALAVTLASRLSAPAGPALPPPEEPGAVAPGGPRHAVPFIAAAMALSGFAAMGLEIVWFRLLGSAMGSCRAVFSLLLTVILAGMWAGATLGGALHRRLGSPARMYLVVQVLFVVATLGLLATFNREAADRTMKAMLLAQGAPEAGLSRAAQGYANIRAIAAVVGVPAVLMGSTFPLANAAVQRLEAEVGRRAGALYLANTAGAVLGSLVAGFVLLPALGTQGAVLALAITAGAAVVPLYLSTRRDLRGEQQVGPDEIAVAGGVLIVVAAASSWGMLLPADHLQRKILPDPRGERFLAVSEGPNETLAVSVGPGGDRRLWTNGHSMSSTAVDAQRYMRTFAHVPLLQMDAPSRVLVICFGVGNTVHATSLHPSVQHIDVADLSRNVLEHASFFARTNGGVLEDPRVSVFVNDGRQHLRMVPPGTYDLITLEPPPIAHAGVSALYSKEFYELARSRLSASGWFSQWLPVSQLHGPEALSLVRAFVDVFPASVLLSGDGRELVLVGTTGPAATLDPALLARRLQERPRVAEDLERVDLGKLSELVGTFAAGAETLHRATAAAKPVTDDAPSMEYSIMSKHISVHIPPELFDVGGVAAFCPGCSASAHLPGLVNLDAHLAVLGRLYASNAFLRMRSFAPSAINLEVPAALEGDADGARARAVLGSRYLQSIVGIDPHGAPVPLKPARLAALEAFAAKHPESAVAEARLGLAYLATGGKLDALAALDRAAELAPKVAAVRFGRALARLRAQRFDDAVAEYRAALALAPRDTQGRAALLAALSLAGKDAEMPAEIARLLEIDPGNGEAHHALCVLSLHRGEVAEARDHCEHALEGGAPLDQRLLEAVGLN